MLGVKLYIIEVKNREFHIYFEKYKVQSKKDFLKKVDYQKVTDATADPSTGFLELCAQLN